ncbi:MAG: autotransporter-associated beta strand repeat-containing protein [Kiritimatiellae bacterium]|nr:autotransporter-associated beta strand repeat-containing protein [Kiritimatiellia bacterium]
MNTRSIVAGFCLAAVFGCSAWAGVPELVHRWSFNGDYSDSIGGSTATQIGSSVAFNQSHTAVEFFGDGNSSGSLNLGTDMLPTDVAEVTVEIWATQTVIKNWARIVDYGPDNKNYFIAAWNNGTNAERDQVKIAKADSAIMTSDGALCPFTLITPYHFSFTFKANADGSSNVRWMRRNATTGAVENFGQYWVPDWHLSSLASPKLYIGHSQYTSDSDANAIYDEVRVWKGILTDDQLNASVLAGPDALPNVGTATTVTTVYWTGAVDNDVTNASNWSPSFPDGNTLACFSGDFAAQIPAGSAFVCAGILFEDARLTGDCDWRGLTAKIAGGTLDLAGHTLTVAALDGEGTITSPTIPAEYLPLEYIESSGKQWVNTGFTPACTDRIEIKLRFANKTGTQCLWCARGTTTSANTFTSFMINGNLLRFDRNGNTAGGNKLSPTAGVDSMVVADGWTLKCTLDGADAGMMAGKGGFTVGGPIVLFASHTSGANLTPATVMGNWASYRLYSFKVYDWRGGLKCDFVPVKRVEDGELGVYDRIGGTFAANMTDTPLSAGAELSPTGESDGGELVINTLYGVTSVNEGVRISGGVKVTKAGAGNFTVKAPMTNSGGTDFIEGTLDIAGNQITVNGLEGNGTITSSVGGNLIFNPGFENNPVDSGARICKSPEGWNYSGTVYIQKNNRDYGNSQANGSVWCFIDKGANISQSFKLDRASNCKLSIQLGTRNNSGTQWKSNGNVQIDGVTVISWESQNNLTTTRTGSIYLNAGVHKITISCTSNSGALFDNISLVPSGRAILAVNVPEGETSENSQVAITGGAGMQVWKTGKGKLIMTRANSGFGAGGRRSGSVSMMVKEGVVKQTATEGTASCGAQYGTIVVEDGAQFDMSGRVYHDYDYVIAGSGPDGAGALVNTVTVSNPWATGDKNRAYLQDVTLSGDATIGGPETWALLFYNYLNEHTMYMNGHTLTVKGVILYSDSIAYSGAGKIVIEEDATVEFYHNNKSAPDCEVEVRGTLQQHDVALSPVKALRFKANALFNNTWTTRPEFVVYEAYAPNIQARSGSAVPHPTVTLGADGHLETTLDLSLFTDTFDSSSLTFYPGTTVTVDLGERTFEDDTLLASWDNVPPVQEFIGAGAAVDAKQVVVAARNDGLWAICLKPERPATAIWTGGGAAEDLLDPANWNCKNAAGTELIGAVPGDFTTVIIDGDTTLNIPEDATVPWGRVQLGDGLPKATQWGRIFYGADRYSNSTYPDTSYINIALNEYESQGNGDIANLDGQNTVWQYSYLDWAQLRFDGWFCVTETQAGSWHITQSFDDYFGFAVDGNWVVLNRTYTAKTETDIEIAAGWHRFTIICGDTWGGQGSRDVSVNGVKTPMAISINGGLAIAFSASNFQMGSGGTVIKLGCDCDWRALRNVVLESGATIDLNGHVLKVAKIACDDYVGASVINSANTIGELQIEVGEGETFSLAGITIKDNVRVVKIGAGTLAMVTAGQTFSGGTVVEAGTLKPGLIGTKFPLGSINLLKNGSFDDGTVVGNNSGNWSYANGGNGFVNPYWDTSTPNKIGLSKASGTWVASGRGIGKYALFLQTDASSTSEASQTIVVSEPGTYRYAFYYAGRPKYLGATTELRLIYNGVVTKIASVTTTADTYSVCEGEVTLNNAGSYIFQFYQPTTSGDKANTFDNIIFARCDAGVTQGAVTVNEGAVFETNGKYDFWYNAFVLNGGTLQNTTADIGNGTSQLKYVFLTADSAFNFQNHCGFIGNGYTRAILDLGGYTLSVALNSGGKLFYLYNTEVRNGILDVMDGGWLEIGNAGVIATDASFRVAAAMRVNAPVDLRDYTAYRASSNHNEGTGVLKVFGTFTPMTDYFYGCEMQNGSVVNLSGNIGSWDSTSTVANGSKTVTFAEGATITVDLRGRADLIELSKAEKPYVITWTTAPTNVSFVADEANDVAGYRLIVEEEGLKLLYTGATLFIIH